MREEAFSLGAVPAVVYGEEADRVFLFVHGRCGCKEEGRDFAALAAPFGWQVLAVDLPEHGARQGGPEPLDPWHTVPELQSAMEYARGRWRRVALRATSIGAWFSMLAFDGAPPERSLLVSPVLDMAGLIETMLGWAGATAEDLRRRETISTNFGETLSWRYYQYALAHPTADWPGRTDILYAGRDNMTSRATAEAFAACPGRTLTVMEDGEHWFHTPQQLAVLEQWTMRMLTEEGETV